MVAPAAGRTDGMAITALILGIVAIPGAFFYGVPGIILGALAITFGLVARGRIRRSGGMVGGSGMATAGWILGICGVVIGIAFIAFLVVLTIGVMQASQH
jgi:hypothetical protein